MTIRAFKSTILGLQKVLSLGSLLKLTFTEIRMRQVHNKSKNSSL